MSMAECRNRRWVLRKARKESLEDEVGRESRSAMGDLQKEESSSNQVGQTQQT